MEVKASGVYAILADEARSTHSEQLALCVRYVSQNTVKKRLLSLIDMKPFNAQAIAEALLAQLQRHNIAELKCVAQTYDGASVMSGHISGV